MNIIELIILVQVDMNSLHIMRKKEFNLIIIQKTIFINKYKNN